jgi:hypothetical protein
MVPNLVVGTLVNDIVPDRESERYVPRSDYRLQRRSGLKRPRYLTYDNLLALIWAFPMDICLEEARQVLVAVVYAPAEKARTICLLVLELTHREVGPGLGGGPAV